MDEKLGRSGELKKGGGRVVNQRREATTKIYAGEEIDCDILSCIIMGKNEY